MSSKTNRRRTLFIKRRFQLKFFAWVIILLIVCCFCSAAVLYPLLSSEVSSQLTAGHRHTEHTGDHIVLAILTGNLLAIIVAALASVGVILYISHKIAGPLYRFQRVCEEVEKGNYDISATLRDADQLTDLSQAFSVMLAALRDRQQSQRDRLEQLHENAKTLKEGLVNRTAQPEDVETLLNGLTALIDEATALKKHA